MFFSIKNSNPGRITLYNTIIRENLSYFAKFVLLLNVIEHIDTYQIFHDVYIYNLTMASDIEYNS